MRSGWIKGALTAFVVAFALLYLGSIKREVHTHAEKLQRAHQNDTIRGQGILRKMDKMEADIDRLCESESKFLSFFLFIFNQSIKLYKHDF